MNCYSDRKVMYVSCRSVLEYHPYLLTYSSDKNFYRSFTERRTTGSCQESSRVNDYVIFENDPFSSMYPSKLKLESFGDTTVQGR